MPQTLAGDHVEYRSKLLTFDEARRFARCIAGNGQYQEATVRRCPAARTARCFRVFYQPTDETRRLRLLANQQTARRWRAEQEGSRYRWAWDEDAEGWRVHTCSGQSYEIDAAGEHCDCADYVQRCLPAGLRCKHLQAFDLRLGAWSETWPTYPTTSVSDDDATDDAREQTARDRDLLFAGGS